MSRATRTEVTAGGKGVNVCRTLRALGDSPRLIGLSPASDPRLADLLAGEGCDFLPVPRPARPASRSSSSRMPAASPS